MFGILVSLIISLFAVSIIFTLCVFWYHRKRDEWEFQNQIKRLGAYLKARRKTADNTQVELWKKKLNRLKKKEPTKCEYCDGLIKRKDRVYCPYCGKLIKN